MKTQVLIVMMMLFVPGSLVYADGAQPAKSLVNEVVNDEGEKLVADSFNRTLYVFDLDQGKAAPACAADCAEVWPPYIVSDEEAAVLVAPLGTIVRANKKLQLTYDSRPVYTYAFDRDLGDDKGDGLGGVWHYIELEH